VHPVGDTALQRKYEWKNAAIYFPYVTGSTFGALSDKNQPKIFRTWAISGDIIAS